MMQHARYRSHPRALTRVASYVALGLAALSGVAPLVLAQDTPPAGQQPAPKLPLKLFAQLERTRWAEISPDGKHFVSISNKDGHYCVMIHPLPLNSGKTILYPPYDPHFEVRWAHWRSDSRVLVSEIAASDRGLQGSILWHPSDETRLFSAAADGSAFINVIRPLKEEATGSMISHENANVAAFIQDDVIDWLPNEQDQVLVAIRERQSIDEYERHGVFTKDAAVRKVNVASGEYTYLKSPTKGIVTWRTDQAHELRLGFGRSFRGEVNRWFTYRDPATGEWRESSKSPLLTDHYVFLEFDSDPHYAFVLGPTETGRRGLLRWDMVADKPSGTLYSDPQSEVERVVYAPDHSRKIIGVAVEDRLVYLDPLWKRRMESLHDALPGLRLEVTSGTRDGTQFIVHAFSATEPGVYYQFDAEKHKLTAMDYARSGLEPEQMAPVRWIEYQAQDGLTIHGLLTLPRGLPAKNLPAVLLPHGGPIARDSLVFDWIAQFLANRGYAVLQPNFRGSTGYGIAFVDAGDRQWGHAMQDDLTDGAQWLTHQGIADPKRMAIVGGWSYGGYAALMGTIKTPDLFRCAVSFNSVSDLMAWLNSNTSGFKDEEQAKRIGDPSADRDMLEAVSPIRQIDKIKVPILLIHAKDDLQVKFDQSQRMYDALQKAGKPSKFVPLESGEHWMLNEAARTQFLTALEEFLASNMQPLQTQ